MITLQRLASLTISSWNCAGELGAAASAPSAARRAFISGELTMAITSLFRRCTTGAGVPLGASNPYQLRRS